MASATKRINNKIIKSLDLERVGSQTSHLNEGVRAKLRP